MFSWLLEVVNSGSVSDTVSNSKEAFATVPKQANQIGMFFLGMFVGVIISIIAFTLLHCFLHTDDDHNQEDE